MAGRRWFSFLGLLVLLMPGPDAWALIPGGRLRRADCLAEWRVAGRSLGPTRGVRAVDCEDGDPSCDADGTQNGRCVFDVSVCTLQRDPLVPECVAPAALSGIRNATAGLSIPHSMSEAACGRATPFVTRLQVRRPRLARKVTLGVEEGRPLEPRLHGEQTIVREPIGVFGPSRRLRLRMTALAAGMRDVNRLALRCVPSSVCPQPACPPSSFGPDAPNDVLLDIGGLGSELDLGSSGAGHNLVVPPSARVHLCLDGCGTTFNPHCNATLLAGAGTANGALFGSPRPVLTADLPICVVSEYEQAAMTAGSADLDTGAIAAMLPLRMKLFVTSPDDVCPRCTAGRCAGGANDGGTCTVDATVPAGRLGDPLYEVSKSCLPSGSPVGSFVMNVPVTTGTSVLEDDVCGGAESSPCTCDAACTGDACASTVLDSATGAFVCVDARGGISQACCAEDPTRPCFTVPVTRLGRNDPPIPPWPDTFYPKTSRLFGAGTFCAGETGSAVVNAVLGLPGPAAMLFGGTATWSVPLSGPCGPGGVPAPY